MKFTRDLDIELFGNRTYTESFSQQLDVIDDLLSETPRNAVGNFSISMFMVGMSLQDGEELFQTFKDNRAVISQRLADESGANIDGFGSLCMQVLGTLSSGVLEET